MKMVRAMLSMLVVIVVMMTMLKLNVVWSARGDNLLTDHMFISILGLGLRDKTPLFLRVLHFPPPPLSLDMLSLVTVVCGQNVAAVLPSNRANRGVYSV